MPYKTCQYDEEPMIMRAALALLDVEDLKVGF